MIFEEDLNGTISNPVASVIVYFFATLFLGLGVITFIIAIRLHLQPSEHFSIPKIVFTLLPLICFSRGGMLAILEAKNLSPLTPLPHQLQIELFFSALPGYLTVSIYMLIVLFWVVLMYKIHGMAMNFMKTIRYCFIAVNFLIYGTWIALLVKIFTEPNYQYWHIIEAYFAAGLTFAVSFVACLCGFFVYRKLKLSQTSAKRRTLATKTGTLTILVTFLYAFRGVAIICAVAVNSTIFVNQVVTVLGWAFGEFLPHMLISLVIYPSNDGEKKKLLQRHVQKG